MFTSKVDSNTQQEVNKMLVSGEKLSDVASVSGLSYAQVSYIRKKLVKAGALQPLYRTARKKRATRQTKTNATTNQTIVNPSSTNQGFKLMVNGTTLDIQNVKSVYVSPEVVDIKY
jgi:hypothetical protein